MSALDGEHLGWELGAFKRQLSCEYMKDIILLTLSLV